MKILVACEESQTVCKAFRANGHEAYSCDILQCSGGRPDLHIQADIMEVLRARPGVIKYPWDMVIAFPPCTYLTCSAEWAYKEPSEINKNLDPNKLYGEKRKAARLEAIEFVKRIYASCDKVCIENPVGVLSSQFRKPNQTVHPWMFGEDASKRTCFWLKDLPELTHGAIVPPQGYSRVAYAADMLECEMCGEPFCPEHNDHYADCECIGPHESCTFKKIDGYEFATRLDPAPRPVWGNQTPSGQNKLGPSKDRAKLRSKTFQGIADAMAEQWG